MKKYKVIKKVAFTTRLVPDLSNLILIAGMLQLLAQKDSKSKPELLLLF